MSESFGLESSIRSLEEQAKSINSSYTKNTDLIGKGVDNLVGVFGGETVEKIYINQIVDIQKQAKSLLTKLHIETLTDEQKVRLERLKNGKLEDIGIVQMTKNTDLKQAIVNGAYGVKGEISGTLHGIKVMITGVFDLAVFMGKYAGSMLGVHPEYKTKINEQATQLIDWIKKEGRVGIQDKVFELIEQEMTRISTLPQEDQAEAIGNIAGNIIGMLTGIKAGITLASKSGEMAGKVAQVARITEKLAKRATVNTRRISQVGNLGKQAGYIRMGATVAEKTLNGVAESLIGYGFAKGLSVTWELIRNSTVSVSKKLSSIEKTIIEMEGTLKTETNTTQQEVIQEEIQKLREEKVKIQRPDQNLDELKVNASLLPEARIQKVRELLETPERKLTKEQIDMSIHIHENISKGVFNNDYATLKVMTKELKRVGLDEKDARKLMENGILGNADDTISNLRQSRLNQSELILENAKQNGATLLREGEILMRAHPGISGEELGKLIRQRANEKGIKITPTQERILDAQMRQYDGILEHYWGKNKREYITKNPLDSFRQLIPELYSDNADFITASAYYLKNINSLDSETRIMVKVLLGEIDDPEYFKARNIKRKDIIERFLPYLGIEFDANTYPGVIIVKTPHEIHNTFLTTDDFSERLMNGNSLGVYQHSLPGFLFISKEAGKDTIEHEYQHFLDNLFLNPILLPGTVLHAGKPISEQEKRYGRILVEPVGITERIWKSMQGELCSYIERNGLLPKDIENYLNGTLIKSLKNGEIPKENIGEMERAIQELSNYFNNPNFPREELVGVIRTSYSMKDMINRLHNKYVQLFPDSPNTQLLHIL